MKILSYVAMQGIHTIRLWTAHEVEARRPTRKIDKEELISIIEFHVEQHRRFLNSHKIIMQVFQNEEDLVNYILNTFMQEHNHLNTPE